MTQDRTPLITLTHAPDEDYFDLLRGLEKSDCNRCKTGEKVTAGSTITDADGTRRREMHCRCGFQWSVVA